MKKLTIEEDNEPQQGLYIVDYIDRINGGDTGAIIQLSKLANKLSNWNFIELCSDSAFGICAEQLRSQDDDIKIAALSLMGMYFYHLQYKSPCRDCDMKLAIQVAYKCNDDNWNVRAKAYWVLSNFVVISDFSIELINNHPNVLILAVAHEQMIDDEQRKEVSKQSRWFLCNLLSLGKYPVVELAITYGLNVQQLQHRVQQYHDDLTILDSIYCIKDYIIKHNQPI